MAPICRMARTWVFSRGAYTIPVRRCSLMVPSDGWVGERGDRSSVGGRLGSGNDTPSKESGTEVQAISTSLDYLRFCHRPQKGRVPGLAPRGAVDQTHDGACHAEL